MQIYIFEDDHFNNFLPIVYFKPVYELKCGALSLREKIEKYTQSPITNLHCREELSDFLSESISKKKVNHFNLDHSILLNGRILVNSNLLKNLKYNKNEDKIFINGNTLVAAYLRPKTVESLREKWVKNPISIKDFDNFSIENIDVRLIEYPWDLLKHNAEEIANDFVLLNKQMKGKKILGEIHKSAHLINRKMIIIDREAQVKAGAVLDASNGPIIIGMGSIIMPNAVIIGPAFVGDNTVIKIGAKIYPNTSIGEHCKIGGEVDSSIIQSYTNKQHDGYLGNAYIGSWVNIGADTNNSDLKNNYSNVKVTLNGKLRDTGLTHFGMLIGDHTKTGINMMFDTGTIIGTACNLYGAGLPTRYIPSFVRGSASGAFKTHSVDMALETAKIAMSRRGVQISKNYENLFRKTFELTRAEREEAKIIG